MVSFLRGTLQLCIDKITYTKRVINIKDILDSKKFRNFFVSSLHIDKLPNPALRVTNHGVEVVVQIDITYKNI